jgi:hypothetical protein
MLGEPDLKIAGFSLWVLAREFPDAADFWDANWLHIVAVLEAKGARVEVEGPLLRNTDIKLFVEQLTVLQETLQGSATLESLEHCPVVRIDAQDGHGHLRAKVTFTDNVTQWHEVRFVFDQTYLTELGRSCRKLLNSFPIIDPAHSEDTRKASKLEPNLWWTRHALRRVGGEGPPED